MNNLIRLCAVNSQFIHSNLAVRNLRHCYDLLCKEHDIAPAPVEVREFSINDPYKKVLLGILTGGPRIVALSVYIWNVDFVARLCSDIRRSAPGTLLVLGGPEVSYGCPICPDHYDYLIAGEGERAFFCLVSDLLGEDSALFSRQYAYECRGREVRCRPMEDLSQIPFIYALESPQTFENRILYYESSRGCPFSCAYCLSACESGVRYLPLERVFQDLDHFIHHSCVPQVKFVDRTFNSSKPRAYEIFRYLMTHTHRPMNFHFEICADLLDEATLDLLSGAPPGLFQFEVGIQTTNQTALALSGRVTDMAQCMSNLERLVAMGNIHTHVDLIAGLPGDDFEDFTRSFDRVYRLGAQQFQLGFLKLLRGTPLNGLVEEYGYAFSGHSPYEILTNRHLSPGQLEELSRVEDVLERYANSQRFSNALGYLEGYFPRPYRLYSALAAFFMEKGLSFQGCALNTLYDLLLEFGVGVPGLDQGILEEYILLDYHSGNPSDHPPAGVKGRWQPYHHYKKEARARVADPGLTARKIGGRWCYFDYSEKNPITNRFDLVRVLENPG